MQCGAASAHAAKGPHDSLLDEVPLIGGGPLDERQAIGEWLVGRMLVVQSEARQEREGEPFLKLVFPFGPFLDLAPGVRS